MTDPASSSATEMRLKVTFKQVTRRLSIPFPTDIEGFTNSLRAVFPTLSDGPITFSYKDEEKDLIEFSTDLELTELVRLVQQRILNVVYLTIMDDENDNQQQAPPPRQQPNPTTPQNSNAQFRQIPDVSPLLTGVSQFLTSLSASAGQAAAAGTATAARALDAAAVAAATAAATNRSFGMNIPPPPPPPFEGPPPPPDMFGHPHFHHHYGPPHHPHHHGPPPQHNRPRGFRQSGRNGGRRGPRGGNRFGGDPEGSIPFGADLIANLAPLIPALLPLLANVTAELRGTGAFARISDVSTVTREAFENIRSTMVATPDLSIDVNTAAEQVVPNFISSLSEVVNASEDNRLPSEESIISLMNDFEGSISDLFEGHNSENVSESVLNFLRISLHDSVVISILRQLPLTNISIETQATFTDNNNNNRDENPSGRGPSTGPSDPATAASASA